MLVKYIKYISFNFNFLLFKTNEECSGSSLGYCDRTSGKLKTY